jgi:hypothetical protein
MMKNTLKDTWETYVESWKVTAVKDKHELFKQCLATDCQYNDPQTLIKGWDKLLAYMQEFHLQIPGGYFVTTYYLTHSNKSIARWVMRTAENLLGEGISYGEYNDDGKLKSMTGFFELPQE